jgi:spermidine/putrescine-binding protein
MTPSGVRSAPRATGLRGRMTTMRPLLCLLCVVTLLAACTRSEPDIEETAARSSASPSAVATADGGCEVGETDGELVLFNWTEYIDPELIDRFRDEFAVDVIQDFYPSNEELLARVQDGSSGYDVVVPSDYMVGIMIEEDLLMPLDRDAIPNGENLAEEFRSPPFDPEGQYHMPYQWGTTGLALNLETAGSDDPEPTWGWLFDPELSDGRISLLDDPRESMAAALAYLGHSINSTSEAELREAADLIAETSSRVAAFESDQFEDLLLDNQTTVAHGYSGDFFAAFDERDAWEDYTYLVPEEGAVKWVDAMAILADAPHPCTAHTFINFIMNARNGAQLTNWVFYASPNAAAEEFIDPEILEDPAIYPPPEVEENLEFLEDTGDTETLYSELFSEATGG